MEAGEPWYHRAACAEHNWANTAPRNVDHNPEIFFPKRAEGGQCAPAKRFCQGCPVRVDCLRTGLRESSGVWGGLSEKERREAHRMFKNGMTLERIIAHFDAIEPKRKRKSAIPTFIPGVADEDEDGFSGVVLPFPNQVDEEPVDIEKLRRLNGLG